MSKELLQAVKANNMEEVEKILAQGNFDINFWDPEAKTQYGKAGINPLTQAVINKNLAMVKRLILEGANINDGMYVTPLAVAAREGDLDMLEYLLSEGANITEFNDPIKWAFDCGHLFVAKILINDKRLNKYANKNHFAKEYPSINKLLTNLSDDEIKKIELNLKNIIKWFRQEHTIPLPMILNDELVDQRFNKCMSNEAVALVIDTLNNENVKTIIDKSDYFHIMIKEAIIGGHNGPAYALSSFELAKEIDDNYKPSDIDTLLNNKLSEILEDKNLAENIFIRAILNVETQNLKNISADDVSNLTTPDLSPEYHLHSIIGALIKDIIANDDSINVHNTLKLSRPTIIKLIHFNNELARIREMAHNPSSNRIKLKALNKAEQDEVDKFCKHIYQINFNIDLKPASVAFMDNLTQYFGKSNKINIKWNFDSTQDSLCANINDLKTAKNLCDALKQSDLIQNINIDTIRDGSSIIYRLNISFDTIKPIFTLPDHIVQQRRSAFDQCISKLASKENNSKIIDILLNTVWKHTHNVNNTQETKNKSNDAVSNTSKEPHDFPKNRKT